jgi:hypothetical protein
MDPATLATAALAAALPYIASLGKEAAKGAAGAAGKSIWEWVKSKLTSEAGKEAVKDLESGPDDTPNRMAVEAALTKHLRSEPGALPELADLLKQAGVTSATLSAIVTGDRNVVGQVAGSGTVSITQGKNS